MNHKPQEEFDFVKIVTLEGLRGYMEYFKPILSPEETRKIADYLVSISGL